MTNRTLTNKDLGPLLKQAWNEWNEDHATRLSAALAYYTMLSLAPLLVISIKLIGLWFHNTADAQLKVTAYLQNFVGPQSAEALKDMTQKALEPGSGMTATTISMVVLLFSAAGVFGELQDAMDTVWEVKPKPDRSWKDIVRERFMSLTLVLGTAFMLLVTLIVNTMITAMVSSLDIGWFLSVVNFILSLLIVAGLFTLIHKYLPDAKVPWKPALYGGILTAILFTLGKYLLAWYLGRGSTTSVYGAAGSLAALLIWTYYSGCILFFGAEFTQAIVKRAGVAPAPAANAVKMTETDRVRRGAPHTSTIAHAAGEYRAVASDIPPLVVEKPVIPRKPVLAGTLGLATGAVLGAVGTYLAERTKPSPAVASKRAHDIRCRIANLEKRIEAARQARVALAHRVELSGRKRTTSL